MRGHVCAAVVVSIGTLSCVSSAFAQVTMGNTSVDVRGHVSDSSSDSALRVEGTGNGQYAFYVTKLGGSGVAGFSSNNGSTGTGAAGYSANYYGVYGYTGTANHNYGLYSPDNLFTRNVQISGAIMMVAKNGGSVPLEPGDVAEIRGIAPSGAPDRQPILEVGPSLKADSTAVAGVVHCRFAEVLLNAPPVGIPAEEQAKVDSREPIRTGEYMLLVVYGPAQVKTSSIGGSIAPGDLLTTGDLAGMARKVSDRGRSETTGAVLGKALEPVGEGQALSYMFVTLR